MQRMQLAIRQRKKGKMRSLREDERDEIESVKYLLKYILSKKDVEGFYLWNAMQELARIVEKYVITEIVTEEELSEILDLDDVQELNSKTLSKISHYLKTGEMT